MLKSLHKSATDLFWITTVATVTITTFAMLALGKLVGRTLEDVMILHDFFTAICILTGAGIIGVLMFSSQTVHNAVKVCRFLQYSQQFLYPL